MNLLHKIIGLVLCCILFCDGIARTGKLGRTLLGDSCGPRIGDTAPAFKAKSTKGPIRFPQDFAGKWIIFFSHPADFTPVCKTEFKRLAQLVDDFKELNTAIVGLSVDKEYTHEIWMRSLEKELKKEGKKKRKVNFPVVADPQRAVARHYGMIHPKESLEQTVRSVFIIDPKGIVRAIFFYPISTGRGFNEIKRTLQALQIAERDNVATGADWQPGRSTIAKKKAVKDVMPD